MKKWAAIVLALGILVLSFFLIRGKMPPASLRVFLTPDAVCEELEPLPSAAGDIRRYSLTLSRGSARAWVFPDGSVFWCESAEGAFSLSVPDFSVAAGSHLDPADRRSVYFLHGTDRTILLQPPLGRETGALDGTNYVAKNEENGTVSYENDTLTVAFSGQCGDWWAYLTPGDINGEDGLAWLSRCTVEKFGADNRLTLDGYYYTTPGDYTPSGENCYYRIPAAYIASKLACRSDSLHGYQMATAMLDLQQAHYYPQGFLPTCPESGWLSRDYGIGPGFYDTRFNTDIAMAYLALGRELGIETFTRQAMEYAAYLVNHAKNHAVSTGDGILVDDYAHPDGNSPTHCSLNHQLAEILFLLQTEDTAAESTALRMLRGVEETEEHWVREDGNLHYARFPDGAYGDEDYPYLTYNDLLALNRYLGGNAALERLMETKRTWMDANGVTGYNQ